MIDEHMPGETGLLQSLGVGGPTTPPIRPHGALRWLGILHDCRYFSNQQIYVGPIPHDFLAIDDVTPQVGFMAAALCCTLLKRLEFKRIRAASESN